MKKLIISLLLGLFFMFTSFANTNADNPTEADIKTFFTHLSDDSKNGSCKIEIIDKHIESVYATFAVNNSLLNFFDKATNSYGDNKTKYTNLINVLNDFAGTDKVKNNKVLTFVFKYVTDLISCKVNSL